MAVAECMRSDGAVQMVVRTALGEVVIQDVTRKPGTIVVMLTGAANRDPAVFSNPDEVDFHRGSNITSRSFWQRLLLLLGRAAGTARNGDGIKRFPQPLSADAAEDLD
jgi:hypothetical protein